ncbi:MAG TPA: hypothetical protein VFO39_12005 [Candidatus Sulfotelmatobacter sp.]|nr:hypothetical protein [Candidatus Sulfotelmatobacter sp.]
MAILSPLSIRDFRPLISEYSQRLCPSTSYGGYCCCGHPAAPGYWRTIDDDYHWHIEILPVLGSKARSYTFEEVYYSPVTSETAVRQLREAKIDG